MNNMMYHHLSHPFLRAAVVVVVEDGIVAIMAVTEMIWIGTSSLVSMNT